MASVRDETFPSVHVLDEPRSETLVTEVGPADGWVDRQEIGIGREPLRVVVVKDRHSTENREVGPSFERALDICWIVQLAGDADGDPTTSWILTSVDVGDDLDQRATLPRFLFRFLEAVPERQIQEINITSVNELLCDLSDLGQLHAEPLR